jgi:hypothetical protein
MRCRLQPRREVPFRDCQITAFNQEESELAFESMPCSGRRKSVQGTQSVPLRIVICARAPPCYAECQAASEENAAEFEERQR